MSDRIIGGLVVILALFVLLAVVALTGALIQHCNDHPHTIFGLLALIGGIGAVDTVIAAFIVELTIEAMSP